MKVFIDAHHHALTHSLYLLFEKRLGWEVYIPHGLDWYKSGYWQYSFDPVVIKQYLSSVPDRFNHLFPTSQYCGVEYRRVELEEFKKTEFDIIIPSVHCHEKTFEKLRQRYQPNAKLIRQEGNTQPVIDTSICKNVMCSNQQSFDVLPDDINKVRYHQEFDLNTYKYEPYDIDIKYVRNFVNGMMNDERFVKLWNNYKTSLPNHTFRMHGADGEDGIVHWNQVHTYIKYSMFTWMTRFVPDYEFGHSAMNSLAMGRPLITNVSEYYKNTNHNLLRDEFTCIDISNCSFARALYKINYWSEEDNYKEMSKLVYNMFMLTHNFDREFEYELKPFIENLI